MKPEVADEEKVQWRAFHYLLGPLQLRGLAEAEPVHRLWNDVKRSFDQSMLLGPILKATAVCNFSHGPYKSGRTAFDLRTAADHLMNIASEEFLQEVSERVAFDQGHHTSDTVITPEQWLGSDCICKRTAFASCLV